MAAGKSAGTKPTENRSSPAFTELAYPVQTVAPEIINHQIREQQIQQLTEVLNAHATVFQATNPLNQTTTLQHEINLTTSKPVNNHTFLIRQETGYHQTIGTLQSDLKFYTAFTTPDGEQIQFRVMPFCLKNAPAI
ncbi:hypothetical protein PR048_005028 [Dryococelus australis]|uniref:Uncharacterized protein n=1 Tax=Dryococelus australis TaxID=614101 RepID=A0ABQ9I950_9NEOP|nr:hypothetical protein PR048_005028 [Dryococelus australis]